MKANEWVSPDTFSFGDSPVLAELVLGGKKTATCWPTSEGEKTRIGKKMVMLDGSGASAAVLETVELIQQRFDQVDSAFAFDEGEGDRSLDYWGAAHRRYFSRYGVFSPEMELWCERFRIAARRS
jgi:uncharacterized protein YhfF